MMKYYIVEKGHSQLREQRMLDNGETTIITHPVKRDPRYDLIAFARKHSVKGWQIYLKERNQPPSSGKLYADLFGGVYDLNKPKATQRACEEHMYYVHLGRNWHDPSEDCFRKLVQSKLIAHPYVQDLVREKKNPWDYPKEWDRFRTKVLKITREKNWELFSAFWDGKAAITPRPATRMARNLYFSLCFSLGIDPKAAGFEESLF